MTRKPKVRTPAQSGHGWCTECPTQLLMDAKAIKAHFLAAHKAIPSGELLNTVLSNRQCLNGVISTGVVHAVPTDGVADYDRLRSGRLPGEVSAGAYGMGRRK